VAIEGAAARGWTAVTTPTSDPYAQRTTPNQAETQFSDVLSNLLEQTSTGDLSQTPVNGVTSPRQTGNVSDESLLAANWLVANIMQNLSVPGLDTASTESDGWPSANGFATGTSSNDALLTILESALGHTQATYNPGTLDAGAVGSSVSAQSSSIAQTPFANLTASTAQIRTAIQDASQKYGVPASLIRGVIEQESGMNPRAVSSAGAVGLMQLMPDTARSLGVENPLDPVQNINGGSKYLAQLLGQFGGNASLALAAYNAGPGAVQKNGGIPPYTETQNYVSNVLALTGQFQNSGW
jgi:hypothetical protein